MKKKRLISIIILVFLFYTNSSAPKAVYVFDKKYHIKMNIKEYNNLVKSIDKKEDNIEYEFLNDSIHLLTLYYTSPFFIDYVLEIEENKMCDSIYLNLKNIHVKEPKIADSLKYLNYFDSLFLEKHIGEENIVIN